MSGLGSACRLHPGVLRRRRSRAGRARGVRPARSQGPEAGAGRARATWRRPSRGTGIAMSQLENQAESQLEAQAEAAPRRRSPLLFLLPLVLFGALAVVFLVGLFAGDASKVPSALIGKPAPPVTLTALEGLQRDGRPVPAFGMADLAAGRATIVNVFASWCAPCRVEHPFLVALADSPQVKAGRVAVVGINYKDDHGECAPVPRRARQSLFRGRRRSVGPRRDRMGRLWRAGNLRDRARRAHSRKACRPARRRERRPAAGAGGGGQVKQGRHARPWPEHLVTRSLRFCLPA